MGGPVQPPSSPPSDSDPRRRYVPASLIAELNEAREALRKQQFNPKQHDSEARREITKLFLKWYFVLIAFAFLFSAGYNFYAAYMNIALSSTDKLKYLEITNTVSLITTTLSSGVGFVIGYYFKNKEDRE